MRRALPALSLTLALAACGEADDTFELPPPGIASSESAATDSEAVVSVLPPLPAGAVREGGALVRSAAQPALYLADEDRGAVRLIGLPVDWRRARPTLYLEGHPAQVLPLADRVLVTLRDPGALLAIRLNDDFALEEVGRVPLPADAWGIAVTPDGRTALVSSAWSGEVSAVDVERMERLWSVKVAREPRAIAIAADGATAYVSHLVGAELTRLSFDRERAEVTRVALPAAPLRAPWGQAERIGASLGYALALAPDGRRLYAARQALGSVGPQAWQGSSTVDVLLTANDQPLAPHRTTRAIGTRTEDFGFGELRDAAGQLPTTFENTFVQPRALVYRKRSATVLVASEGLNRLVELDARAVAPSLEPLRSYELGQRYDARAEGRHGTMHVADVCGAPTGLALSEDEELAYVFCRSTSDLAIVTLDPYEPFVPAPATVADEPRGWWSPSKPAPESAFAPGPVPWIELEDEQLDEQAELGRRLFYDATDSITSGGLGCAGCHPEGRDDGFVWHQEHELSDRPIFVSNPFMFNPEVTGAGDKSGLARQTPVLAGRVEQPGPYGWHGESGDLADRIKHGFALHRWFSWFEHDDKTLRLRAEPLARFLREGLVPPPRTERALDVREQRGRELFLAESTQCSQCHDPAYFYSHRDTFPLRALPPQNGFRADPDASFKVPSLAFVGGTAPYLHDGSAATLDELLAENGDRMGRTNHLSAADRAALAAFLRTL